MNRSSKQAVLLIQAPVAAGSGWLPLAAAGNGGRVTEARCRRSFTGLQNRLLFIFLDHVDVFRPDLFQVEMITEDAVVGCPDRSINEIDHP
jgi:hypothetical protein